MTDRIGFDLRVLESWRYQNELHGDQILILNVMFRKPYVELHDVLCIKNMESEVWRICTSFIIVLALEHRHTHTQSPRWFRIETWRNHIPVRFCRDKGSCRDFSNFWGSSKFRSHCVSSNHTCQRSTRRFDPRSWARNKRRQREHVIHISCTHIKQIHILESTTSKFVVWSGSTFWDDQVEISRLTSELKMSRTRT